MINSILNLKNRIKQLLKKQKLAVLATQGDEYPYNTLVGYAFTKDLKFILFATMRHTRKYNNISRHPKLSMLIDSRKNYVSDFKDAVALTVTGSVVKVQNPFKARYKNLYLKRFPHLKGFVDDPDTSIIAVKVHRYIFVQRFQEVLEVEMK